MIKKALDKAGYDMEPTEENLRECFMDYVDTGAWLDIEEEDIEEISIEDICHNLMRLK
jgi:dimeric dUTPase (all-alpha-NTP-PPase superfamily)